MEENNIVNNQQVEQTNNEQNNNKKSNNTLIICITIIVLAISAVIIVFLLNNKKDDSEPKNNNTNTTETTNNNTNNNQSTNNTLEVQEVEVSNLDDYKYLVDQLYKTCYRNLGYYINLSNISDEHKILVGISNSETKDVKVSSSDEIDMTHCTKVGDNISTDKGIILDVSSIGKNYLIYNAGDISNKVKEIFGKDTVINHQTTLDAFYDKTANAYIVPGHGCNNGANILQKITKVTTSGNKLYIYVSVGSYSGLNEKPENSKICLDYQYNVENTTCINRQDLDDEYLLNSGYELNIDTNKYMEDNIDKFAKYKYTFEKEDNNYIIKGLEKVN